jgi:lysophospholipase L1-like esterase
MILKLKIPFLILLYIIHFLMLHYFGIAWFGSTLLLYYLVYTVIKFILKLIKNEKIKILLTRNIQVLLSILLVLEFTDVFILKVMNNYMENEKGIYFSEYMRQQQLNLLHFIGRKDIQLAWKNGYKPNTKRTHKTSEFNNSFITNNLGLRGKLPPIKKDTNEYRIVVLGDSFIEGQGAPNDSTFPVLLEKNLQNINKKITVINAGICGSNPIYEKELYKNKLKQYQPNLVILETNLTDLQDIEYALHQNIMPLIEYFYAISHIYRLVLYFGFLNNNFNFENASKNTLKKRKIIINILLENTNHFNQKLKTENKILLLLYLPLTNELGYNAIEKKPCIEWKQRILSSKIPMFDLQNEYKKINFTNKDTMNAYYWLQDHHFTPKGYSFMANKVAQELIEKKYVRTN